MRRNVYGIFFITTGQYQFTASDIKTWVQMHESEEACRQHAEQALAKEYDRFEIIAIIEDEGLIGAIQ